MDIYAEHDSIMLCANGEVFEDTYGHMKVFTDTSQMIQVFGNPAGTGELAVFTRCWYFPRGM